VACVELALILSEEPKNEVVVVLAPRGSTA